MLLISINSLGEYTGGGIYARSIYSGLSKFGSVVVVAKANLDGIDTIGPQVVELRKGFTQDFFARVLLCPAFTGFYIVKLLRHIRQHQTIVFHNSRQGGVLWLGRLLFPRKKFIMCFDNVEQLLLRSSKPVGFVKKMMNLVDSFLIKSIERLAYRNADVCTFITAADRQFFLQRYGEKKRDSIVVPVSLPVIKTPKRGEYLAEPMNVLFTASFTFPPNLSAMYEFIDLALLAGSEFQFYLAGKGLDRVADERLRRLNNLHLISDPDDKEMDRLFSKGDIYLAPVRQGSGMKTKVAEALRYGLPVIATEHALIGYEAIINNDYIMQYESATEALRSLHNYKQYTAAERHKLHCAAYDAFLNNYSDSAASDHFKPILDLLKT